jgi:hypothetical protein
VDEPSQHRPTDDVGEHVLWSGRGRCCYRQFPSRDANPLRSGISDGESDVNET